MAALSDPRTWPQVVATMQGFPLPQLVFCREVSIVSRPAGAPDDEHHPDLVIMGDGRTFYLQRKVVESLFGAVFHGIQGHCFNPNNPSTFRLPQRQEDEFHVAVKRSCLERMRRAPHENIFREISVMRYLAAGTQQAGGHQFVMPLVEACMSRTHLYVVTPLCGGGDLLKMVTPGEGTGEANARKWFRQILLGLAYVHSRCLCHHDVSPENVVVTRTGDAAVVMDFGMVKRMPTGPTGEVELTTDPQRFGKLRYMAPEIFREQEYDGRQIDIWSLAVTFLVCLLGDYPWVAPTRLPSRALEIFISDIYRFVDLEDHGARVMLQGLNLTSRVSPAAIDLLCEMLVVDRNHRPSSAEALAQHPFFTS